MPLPQPDNLANLLYAIEFLLHQIAADPANLSLHHELRETALRYKSIGGLDAGLMQKAKPLPADAKERMIHVERLWSLDPGNLNRVQQLLAAVAVVQRDMRDSDFALVRQWLYKILQAGD